MGNAQGEEVDFHAVLFDAYGNGAYDGVTAAFPAAGFGGVGKIGGRPVKCLTAAQIVEFHAQYTPTAIASAMLRRCVQPLASSTRPIILLPILIETRFDLLWWRLRNGSINSAYKVGTQITAARAGISTAMYRSPSICLLLPPCSVY